MATRPTHVLLVDDDVLLCRGLSRTLALHEFEVSTANTAAEAITCIGSNDVDIILLDWILPDRDGVTLLQDLRERGIVAPVIMLSGECSVQGRVRALNRGADDYIAKPFELEELIARIHANLRRHAGLFHVSRIGRIAVDTWKHEVSVDGERVDLTPLEYALLTYLVRNADEVLGKKQIVEAVWTEKGAEGSSKALDLQLLRLRRKLGVAASQIETVRGSGVRITGNRTG
jgi:DNA-binding response OmpR family regulator